MQANQSSILFMLKLLYFKGYPKYINSYHSYTQSSHISHTYVSLIKAGTKVNYVYIILTVFSQYLIDDSYAPT